MISTNKKRGGPGRGQGRKLIGDVGTVTVCIRLTQEQREKLKLLGSAAWVRQKINETID